MDRDYSQTLNLPRTDFPMKANLPEREPEIIKWWEDKRIYHRMLEGKKKTFILHDGPPYANGDIHMGQAYNKILKDIVLKSKALSGYATPFVPGWDCHGLPVELQLLKKLGKRKKEEVDIHTFRKEARNYAMFYVNRQREEFRRLEVFADWKNPYLTMDPQYQAKIMEVFLNLYDKGFIYRAEKPVYWCIDCETALAEAEVEYLEKESPSIWVKFPLILPEKKVNSPAFILIWTTTPWTLPGNLGVALHPDEIYVWGDTGDEVWFLGEKAVERVEKETGVKFKKILRRMKGVELEGGRYSHPIFPEKQGRILLADYVSMEEGSGCVHIAPGHGEEDYLTGKEYGLPPFSPVDNKGYFTSEGGKYQGLRVDEANPLIIKDLKEKGLLVKEGRILHSYPHCWRCKNPIIFRATTQWFLNVDKNLLRKKALDVLCEIKWFPTVSQNRMRGMLEVRPDWCLSRQRIWGVPVPVIYCSSCGRIISGSAFLKKALELVRQHGADVWFEKDEKELLPDDFSCPDCGSKEFRKEMDILDVWMDSGVSHLAVLKTREGLRWPADMYLEGSDQHRGWFQTSLIISMGMEGKPPYREVLTHGFVVDSEGRKMSKSMGNVIDPQEMVKKFGAEILRLWVASTDYSRDMRVSEEILKGNIDAYRKIRNTCRFILGNLYDFDPQKYSLPSTEWWEIDKWIYNRLQKLIKMVKNFYKKYQFLRVYQEIYQFAVKDLSSLYLDILKDRLYVFPSSSPARRAAQTVLYYILRDYVKLMAPILSFTAEEIWKYLSEKEESVFLSSFPEEEDFDEELDEKWEKIWEVRSRVYEKLEEIRKKKIIGSSLEARVELGIPPEIYSTIKEVEKDLPMIFIISQLKIYPSEEWEIKVEKAKGKKCARCWMWSEEVGKNTQFPELCKRCVGFMKEAGYAG